MKDSFEDDVARRIVATGLDLILALVLYKLLQVMVYNMVAALLVALFLAMRDCLPFYFEVGVSPGKSFFGLKVCGDRGTPCDWRVSVKRNLFVALPWLLWILCAVFVAPFIGHRAARVLAVLGGILGLAMEAYRLSVFKDGLRIGDILAGSRVVRQPLAS